MASIAEANSLFEIDMELDALLEEIELQIESEGEPSEQLVSRFQEFCDSAAINEAFTADTATARGAAAGA